MLCKHQVIGSIPIGSTNLRSGYSRRVGTNVWHHVPLTDIFQDEMKQFRPGVSLWTVFAGFARVFDIVNGFLIDAVAVSYRCAQLWLGVFGRYHHKSIYMIIWLR